jgi:Flp pilus assembly protein TadB
MTRFIVPLFALLWGGTALLLSEFRWFRRPSAVDRLRPHILGTEVRSWRTSHSSAGRRAVVTLLPPILEHLGDRLARTLGVAEPVERRLRRIHAPIGPRQFRTRQVGRSIALGAVIALAGLALHLPVLLVLIGSSASALLTFLLIEQALSSRSAGWQRRVFLEVPIICEQLGMLLSAGSSLGQALTRLARRSDAAISIDLAIVVGRINQGVDETVALREWAELVQVPAIDRLLSVLALNREATDLGALISEESRAARAEVHRELIERLERRSQQVWIPVTVATLVPGLLFLAVPFLEAVRLFTTT